MTLRSEMVEKRQAPVKSRATWNDELRQLDYPATGSQLKFLRDLCKRLAVNYVRPNTKREAASAIDKLVRRQKVEANERKRRQAKRRRQQRDQRQRARDMRADWRFGVGQTARQEGQEIQDVNRAGLIEEYEAARAEARAATSEASP
jgi:hypothetical protein